MIGCSFFFERFREIWPFAWGVRERYCCLWLLDLNRFGVVLLYIKWRLGGLPLDFKRRLGWLALDLKRRLGDTSLLRTSWVIMLPSWLASFNFFQPCWWLPWNFLCVNFFGRLFWLLPFSFVWRVRLNKDWLYDEYGLLNHWNSILFLFSRNPIEFSCRNHFMRYIRLPSLLEFL